MREQRPMWTNGCVMTYGRNGQGTCPNHRRMDREETVYHLRADPKVHVLTWSGGMRKHANFKHDRKDQDIARLDAVAAVKSHVWGVLRRRGNTFAVVG